jgi:hypothetical protein
MTERKCPVCARTLLSKNSQLRADDEGATLVTWCPVHGIHYSLYSDYLRMLSTSHFSLESNPNRIMEDIDYMFKLHVVQEMPLINGLEWLESWIKLDVSVDFSDMLIGSREYQAVWSVHTWSTDGFIKVGRVWNVNPIVSEITGCSLSRLLSKTVHTSSISEIKSISCDLIPSHEFNHKCSMHRINMCLLPFESVDTKAMLLSVDGEISFVAFRFVQDVSDIDSCKRLSGDSHLLCCKLLGERAIVPASELWRDWKFSYKSLCYDSGTISVHLSKLPNETLREVVSVISAGTYSIMYICSECAMILDIRMKSGRLIHLLCDVEQMDSAYAAISNGYFSNDQFNFISLFLYSKSSGTRKSYRKLGTVCRRDLIESSNFKFMQCNLKDGVSENWRMLYVGNQSSISVVKRNRSLSNRLMDTSCILSVAHKFLVSKLVRGVSNGLDLVMLIKCYPFEFFRPLTDRCKCIFIYQEDWEIEDNPSIHVSLKSTHKEVDFGDNDQGLYDYSKFEPLMWTLEGGDLKRCISESESGHPIHYNNSTISLECYESNSRMLMIDFYNQNPDSCPMDCSYLSILGSCQMDTCNSRFWGFGQEVKEVDVSKSHLYEFLRGLGQSLDSMHIVCSNSIEPYIINQDDFL